MNDPFWKVVAIVVIGLLTVIAILLFISTIRRRQPSVSPSTDSLPPESDQPGYTESATLEAIHCLLEIDDSFDALTEQELPEQSVEAAIAHNRHLSQTLSSYSTRLGVSQLSSVEPSVAAIFGPMAEFYSQLALVCSDYVAFYERQEICIQRHGGVGMIIESAIRGAINLDIFGRRDESEAAFEQLDAERAELRKRVDVLSGMRNGLLESLNYNADRLAKLHGWVEET